MEGQKNIEKLTSIILDKMCINNFVDGHKISSDVYIESLGDLLGVYGDIYEYEHKHKKEMLDNENLCVINKEYFSEWNKSEIKVFEDSGLYTFLEFKDLYQNSLIYSLKSEKLVLKYKEISDIYLSANFDYFIDKNQCFVAKFIKETFYGYLQSRFKVFDVIKYDTEKSLKIITSYIKNKFLTYDKAFYMNANKIYFEYGDYGTNQMLDLVFGFRNAFDIQNTNDRIIVSLPNKNKDYDIFDVVYGMGYMKDLKDKNLSKKLNFFKKSYDATKENK